MTINVPHPFPVRLKDQVNSDLRRAGVIDREARYAIRKMVADAYAEGFNDGAVWSYWDTQTDQQDEADAS